ncbi:dipeptidase [Actinophytocola oryzae]|uniref:Membrane dipeptidase n=1 Tax=Actinophytocola oryzae TaxID=502181 RepID=A0A4R7VZD8_9PSEU|nr:dipeptidase [Actinophytocola oryzae]TDV55442.1 membrane dipeptidase [Actinophytocola oryzae]
MASPSFERAQALLGRTPLVDGHNDLPWALRSLPEVDGTRSAASEVDLEQPQPGLHTDFPRLLAGGLGMQFWSVYVPCRLAGDEAVTAVIQQAELVHTLAERYPSRLRIVGTAAEAREAFADGRIASMLGAEGGHSINESLGVLRALYRLGVRYMTLTHNDNTPWADSATDEPAAGGLTDFGREVVREMNRIGMLVDLSHVAATTMRDALDVAQAPVIFSHSSCRAVADHPRNVPDDVLERLPDNGGVCMVTFVPAFVSPEVVAWDRALRSAMAEAGVRHADLDQRDEFTKTWDGPRRPVTDLAAVVAHVEHARDVAGIDHIGLGGDYDGCGELPVGLEDVSSYPNLFAALLDRGWSEEDCAKLAGENVLRALTDAESFAAKA